MAKHDGSQDIFAIMTAIKKIIKEIGEQCDLLDEKGEEKAKTAVAYDKAVAIATLRLKKDHPVTLLDKIVKGECLDELYAKIVGESGYKNCHIKITAREAQMNALQSLFRRLDKV